MAAELKEIVGRADAVDHEEVGPDLGEPLFGRGARDDEGRPVVAGAVGSRQCLAVDLAAGQEGDLGELDEDPGHHVLGQLSREPLAQLLDVQGATAEGTT